MTRVIRPCTSRAGSLVASWIRYTAVSVPVAPGPVRIVTPLAVKLADAVPPETSCSMVAAMTLNGVSSAANGLSSLSSTGMLTVWLGSVSIPAQFGPQSSTACGNGLVDETTVTLTEPGIVNSL